MGSRARDNQLVNGAVPQTRALRPGWLRRLYDWVLSWAATPYGAPALAVLAFAESSFFPVPPDPLLIALCLGASNRSLRFALITTLASVAGGIAGYLIGFSAWNALSGLFFAVVPGVTPEAFMRVQTLYNTYDFWAVFVAGLTPIPYKVFTLSAGVFAINFPVFVVASVLSRGARFFLVAALIWRFGQPVKGFIDRYFNTLTWVFAALLIGGFLLVRLVL